MEGSDMHESWGDGIHRILQRHEPGEDGDSSSYDAVKQTLDDHKSGKTPDHQAYTWADHKDKKQQLAVPNYHAKATGQIGSGKPKRMQDDPFSWYDMKHQAGSKLLQEHKDQEMPADIHTSSDLIGHNDYMEKIPEGSTVNLHHQERRGGGGGHPSSLRLKQAGDRLEAAGHNVVYHGNMDEDSQKIYDKRQSEKAESDKKKDLSKSESLEKGRGKDKQPRKKRNYKHNQEMADMLVQERKHESDDKLESQAKKYDEKEERASHPKSKEGYGVAAASFREAIKRRKKA